MSGSSEVLAEHAHRGARIQQLLRLLLVTFFAAILITEPPAEHRGLCWLLVACYLVWSVAVYLLGIGGRTPRLLWLSLFVDVVVLTALTLITDTTAAVSWTPYLIINGFFLIPVIAAAQLSPRICAAVVAPTVVVHLISGLITQDAGQEPTSYVLLRTFVLAAVGLGAVLLSRVQGSRVVTIAGLLADRTALLEQMVTIEQREQQNLAEALHDGALQYVLGARHELEDLTAADGGTGLDPDSAAGLDRPAGSDEAVNRIDYALAEAARLLRSTLSQLHPAVIEQVGLLPALRDLAATTQARGRITTVTVTSRDWGEDDRTSADELLLATARELLNNVIKHAQATTATVVLTRDTTVEGRRFAVLEVTDDGRGMDGIDLVGRLATGHLGLASRRIRVEAAGGMMRHSSVQPHGTRVEVKLPWTEPQR